MITVHSNIYHTHILWFYVIICRKFDQEQWRRARPPNQKQVDNLRMNGARNGKPDLQDWFRNLVLVSCIIYKHSYKI
jgi:hypothetical protein